MISDSQRPGTGVRGNLVRGFGKNLIIPVPGGASDAGIWEYASRNSP